MDFPPPAYIQLYPTSRCNQACSFCFNQKGYAFGELSYGQAFHLLDIVSSQDIREIDIMGGEPFLLPWMTEFIRAARGRGIMINISTNGSLPHAVRDLRGMEHNGLTIGISLEGSTAGRHNRITGAENFDRVIECIDILLRLGLDPLVKSVVCRETAEDIRNIVQLLRDLGVKRHYLIHRDIMTRDDREKEKGIGFSEFLAFFEHIRDGNQDMEIHRVNASCFERDSLPAGVRCAGGVRKLCVMSDGSVYPCNLFQGFPEMQLGNILLDDFREIWGHPMLYFFRTFRGNRCTEQECENRVVCTGGCPAHGLYHFGTMDSPDIRCLVYRENVLLLP